ALKDEPLDFMCYFSSRQAYALLGASKYSAYASGITFADAFARSVQNTSTFPVGIMNWGIWKSSLNKDSAGAAAEGLDLLGDQEGFECFERFVAELRQGRVHQILCAGESRALEALMNCNRGEVVTLAKGPVSAGASLPEVSMAVSKEKFAG